MPERAYCLMPDHCDDPTCFVQIEQTEGIFHSARIMGILQDVTDAFRWVEVDIVRDLLKLGEDA